MLYFIPNYQGLANVHFLSPTLYQRHLKSIIELLLSYKADTRIKNKDGKTCFMIAYDNHAADIGDLLLLNH